MNPESNTALLQDSINKTPQLIKLESVLGNRFQDSKTTNQQSNGIALLVESNTYVYPYFNASLTKKGYVPILCETTTEALSILEELYDKEKFPSVVLYDSKTQRENVLDLAELLFLKYKFSNVKDKDDWFENPNTLNVLEERYMLPHKEICKNSEFTEF